MSKQDVLAAGFWALALVALTVGWRPLNRLAARLRDARLPNLTPAAIGLYVALGLVTAGPFILDRARGAPPPPNSTEHHLAVASEWILANTPPASRVQATWSDRINFATGRPTALLPVTEDPAILRKFEEHFHPRYILVLDDPPTPYLKPIDAVRFGLLQEMYPGRWRLAAELTGARVFEVK